MVHIHTQIPKRDGRCSHLLVKVYLDSMAQKSTEEEPELAASTGKRLGVRLRGFDVHVERKCRVTVFAAWWAQKPQAGAQHKRRRECLSGWF